MSLKLERDFKKLQKEMAALRAEMRSLATDKEMITKVLYETMEKYLSENVEFHMSVDGQIREILKDEVCLNN